MILRDAPSLRRWALPHLLLPVAVLAAVAAGRFIVSGGALPLLATIALIVALIVALNPLIGLYACYPLLFLVPYESFRLDIPVFHSPLQIVAALTLGVAIARGILEPGVAPKNHLYAPILLVILVLAGSAAAGHGLVAGGRLARFVVDLWPLALIPLLVRTPRQARNVLLSLIGSVLGLALLWLPGLLGTASGRTPTGVRQAAAGHIAEPTLGVTLIGSIGALSYLTLVAMALVAPVLLGMGMAARRHRAAWIGAYCFVALTILTSTYAAAVVTLAVGTLIVVIALAISPVRSGHRRSRGILRTLPFALPLALFVLAVPPVQLVIGRVLHPSLDPSGSERLFAFTQGLHAFLAKPLTGYGAFDTFVVAPSGWALAGHNSFVVMAYEFGLLLLVPFIWLLARLGSEYVRLLRGAATPAEWGLAVGFLGSFVAAIVTGFIDPVFGDVVQDAVIWTFAALAVVWNSWKRKQESAARTA